MAGTLSAGAGASSSEIALISKAQRMLQEATSVAEIRQVESLAQLARDCAAKAKHGRETVNSVSRVLLDARRKVGNTLKAMMEGGELAQREKANIPARYIYFGGSGVNCQRVFPLPERGQCAGRGLRGLGAAG